MLIGCRLFIAVNVLWESFSVEAFNPYCSGSMAGKMKCAGHW
jgi:hypothetical protein